MFVSINAIRFMDIQEILFNSLHLYFGCQTSKINVEERDVQLHDYNFNILSCFAHENNKKK